MMLNLLLLKYKWAIYAVLFTVYTVGVWHVSAVYVQSKYVQKELDTTQAVISTTNKNTITKNEISKTLGETIAKVNKQNITTNRNIQNEINKDPVYRDCKSTPSIMHEYQNKLDNQP